MGADMDEKELAQREEKLEERLKHLEELEAQLRAREKKLKEKDKSKKQVLLRLAPSLWNDLAAWAEEDFRSINGQIEYLLAAAVRKHKKGE